MILLSAALMTVAVSCEEKEGKQEEEKLNVPELHADVEDVEIVALSDEKALELTLPACPYRPPPPLKAVLTTCCNMGLKEVRKLRP